MLRWSPTRQFHFHHDTDDVYEAAQPAASWLPAAEGRIKDGTCIIQLALPGMDPKDVTASLMDNVLTVKGNRSSALPEGVDAARVETKDRKSVV